MTLSIVWGLSGVLAGVVILGYAVVFLAGWYSYAEEAPRHPGLRGWPRNWRAVVCLAMTPVCLAGAAAAFWAATHTRTVTLTVAQLRVDADELTSYYVDGTRGESFDATEEAYDGLQVGDRVRCEATDPPLFIIGTLLSCERLHTRYAAASAVRSVRAAAERARPR